MTTPTSTIDPTQPPANTPVASGVVRQQFGRAISDINSIWSYIYGLIPPGGTLVSSFNGRSGDVTLSKGDVTSALGADPTQKMGNFQWISPTDTGLNPIVLVPYAEYAFTVVRLNLLATSVGVTNVTFSINGTPITGLTAINVTTVPQNPVASAANVVPLGGQLTMALSGTVGANNLMFSMLGQL